MNRIIKYVLLFFAIVILAASVKLYLAYKPEIYYQIKDFAHQNLNITLDFSSIALSSIYPLSLRVKDITVQKGAEINFKASELEIQFVNLMSVAVKRNKIAILNIHLSDFKLVSNSVNIAPGVSAPSNSAPRNSAPSVSTSSISTPGTKPTPPIAINSLSQLIPKNSFVDDINLNFILEKGVIETKANNDLLAIATLKRADIFLPSLSSEMEFNFSGSIKMTKDIMNIHYPIAVKSALSFANGWISSKETIINFIGIDSTMKFKYNVSKRYIDFSNKIDISNLNKLPINLIENFPLSKLFGSLKSEAKITGYLDNNPMINGNIELKIFSADLAIKKGDIASSGSFKLNFNSTYKVNKSLALESIKWDADFTKLHFEITNYFKKPANIKLVSTGSGKFIEDFKVDNFNLQFDKFNLTANGNLSKNNFSNFKFTIPEFSLSGYEKFILLLPQFPVKGNVEVKGEILGMLNDPKKLNITIEPFKISNLNFTINKKINDVEIEGPIKANISGGIIIRNQVAEKGDLKGYVDAEHLEIKKHGESLKIDDEPLKLEFKTSLVNKTIKIEKFDLKSLIGHFDIKGKPPVGFNDYFNLTFNLYRIKWDRIRNFLPKNEWLSSIKDISGNGQMTVQGVLDQNDLINSNVKVTSNTKILISEIKLPWNLKIQSTPSSDKEIAPSLPEAFFNNKSLLDKITTSNELTIEKIVFKDNQIIKSINLKASLKDQNLYMKGGIKEFFNGSLNVNEVVVPLTQKDPLIKFQIDSKKMDLGKMISILLPEYSDLIKGSASLVSEGSSYLPYSTNFKQGLFAKGIFNYENGRIDTFNFVSLVKEKLLSFPDIATPKSFEKNPLEGSISSQYVLKNSSITIENFLAKSKQNDEIQLSGKLGANLNSNIKANLKLRNLPLNGDFIKANQDSLGRVDFPIEIEGNIKQPEWSFAANTIQSMTQKYLTAEKNKALSIVQQEVESKKNEATRMIQNEANAQKKKLETEAKKSLKGFFD